MVAALELSGYPFVLYSIESAMSAPCLPEVLRLRNDSPQEALPLATEGVLRYVWEGRFGSMLIEVVDGTAYVNGARVESLNPAMSPDGVPANAARGTSS